MENYIIELGGSKNNIFRRNIYTTIGEGFDKDVENFINSMNNKEVYYSVFTRSNKDIDNCLFYGSLYFDLDLDEKDEDGFIKTKKDTIFISTYLEDVFGIPEKLIKIYFSGSKGFHIVIDPQVFGIEPCKDLNERYKIIAMNMKKNSMNKTVDTKIYDNRRLFRIPNSINGKTGLYKVPITREELRNINNYEDISEYASQQRDEKFEEPVFINSAKTEYEKILLISKLQSMNRKNKAKKTKIPTERKNLLPCVIKLLEEGAGKGIRNNSSVALASSMYQSGLEQDEIIQTLLVWNEKNEPPLPEREIYTTIKSAYGLVNCGKGYGCRFFQDEGFCIGKECELFDKGK